MGNFDEFVEELTNGARRLAKEIFDGFEIEAVEDTRIFLEKTKADLQRWTKLLAQGD